MLIVSPIRLVYFSHAACSYCDRRDKQKDHARPAGRMIGSVTHSPMIGKWRRETMEAMA